MPISVQDLTDRRQPGLQQEEKLKSLIPKGMRPFFRLTNMLKDGHFHEQLRFPQVQFITHFLLEGLMLN